MYKIHTNSLQRQYKIIVELFKIRQLIFRSFTQLLIIIFCFLSQNPLQISHKTRQNIFSEYLGDMMIRVKILMTLLLTKASIHIIGIYNKTDF